MLLDLHLNAPRPRRDALRHGHGGNPAIAAPSSAFLGWPLPPCRSPPPTSPMPWRRLANAKRQRRQGKQVGRPLSVSVASANQSTLETTCTYVSVYFCAIYNYFLCNIYTDQDHHRRRLGERRPGGRCLNAAHRRRRAGERRLAYEESQWFL